MVKVNDIELTKEDCLSYRDYLISYDDCAYQESHGFSMPMGAEIIATYGKRH